MAFHQECTANSVIGLWLPSQTSWYCQVPGVRCIWFHPKSSSQMLELPLCPGRIFWIFLALNANFFFPVGSGSSWLNRVSLAGCSVLSGRHDSNPWFWEVKGLKQHDSYMIFIQFYKVTKLWVLKICKAYKPNTSPEMRMKLSMSLTGTSRPKKKHSEFLAKSFSWKSLKENCPDLFFHLNS